MDKNILKNLMEGRLSKGETKRIKWDDNKEILKKVLEKALKKELFFKKLEIKDYRSN